MKPLFSLSLLIAAAAGPVSAQDPAIRAVWVEQLSGDPDPYAAGETFALMARELPAPPRVLRPGPGNFTRPLLSADGNSVYYTDRHATPSEAGSTAFAPEMFAVPFAGGEPRKLGTGMAVAVWKSPEGSEFIYALTSLQSSRRPGLTGELLVRFHPETPEDREIMWSESALGADNFQLSRDGTRAAGLFPWPQAGLADMTARTFSVLGQGSFPALAPDNSYALAILDGDRRRLRFFVPGVEPGWELQPAPLLPQQAGEINQPRWSNDPRFLTFSGPPATGTAPDVYLAGLRPDLRAMEKITPLSTSAAPDYYPDVRVPGRGDEVTSLTQSPVITPPPVAAPWPVSPDSLHFAWENLAAGPGAFTLHGFASPGRLGALNISGGHATAAGDSLAKLAAACAAGGSFTMEALITERRTQPPCSTRILSLQTAAGADAFALYRVDGFLAARVLTGGNGKPPLTERFTLTPLSIEDDRPFSLFLTLHAGTLQCYLDGQLMKEFSLDQSGLAGWQDLHFSAGDPAPYGSPWTGQVERVALYSRALAAAEIADAWSGTEALLGKRQRPTRCKIKARLLEMPPLPGPELRAAAPAGLHASSWAIEQVFTGYLKPKTITLLQWAWLDGKPVPLPQMKPGQTIELPVEPLEDHPELTGITTHNLLTAGEQPVYFDTTTAGRHPEPFPQ